MRRLDRTGITKRNMNGVLSLPITFDSGDQLERIASTLQPGSFNSENAEDNGRNLVLVGNEVTGTASAWAATSGVPI